MLLMFYSFFCAMIAAVTLRFLDPFGTGKLVLFQVTYDKVRG
jgi:chloride channel 3/4/5